MEKKLLEYDLIVIGGGPAGEKAAAKAAYFKKKVALIEKASKPGGAGVHTGTLPSKTLKETALFLSGRTERGLYGVERKLDKLFSVEDFFYRKNQVIESEVAAINKNLNDHAIDVYHGTASFVGEHEVVVHDANQTVIEQLTGKFILVATGSYPFHPSNIPVDYKRVHDSDSILNLKRFPTSICVIGAGVIGCEYTTIFATLGTKVTLVEGRDAILPFLDKEITTDLVRQMKDSGVDILFNASIEKVEVPTNDAEPLTLTLKSGEILKVDMLLYAAGRSGNTASLGAEKINLKLGKREVVEVNEHYQSNLTHIYAVGDVIGFPALASTSMDQGRIAVGHMFSVDGMVELARTFPYGIYTIPEVSMVGITEEEAKAKNISYAVGRAHHRNLARGKIMGLQDGFIKLVFERESKKVIGVHLIGSLAAEIIHYGLMVVEEGKTLDDLIGTVFNYPTLHDLYKYAAYDGLGALKGYKLREL